MTVSDEDRARSIRQRLLNEVRRRGETDRFTLERYAMERFLFRLGESRHTKQFVLKGAMLFTLWGGSVYRSTRDLDFTGYGPSDTDSVLEAIRQICETSTADDGLAFDAASMEAEPIRDQSEYVGLRIRLRAHLGRSSIPLQVDIGFGNAIEPPAEVVTFPTLLDDPPPRIFAYPKEAVVAEKTHAMVVLGDKNSRFKDFYDLFILASSFPFDGRRVSAGLAATFERRETPIDDAYPVALTSAFFEDDRRAQQWRSYRSQKELSGAPADFSAVGELILRFLQPLWKSLASGQEHNQTWLPGGSWQ